MEPRKFANRGAANFLQRFPLSDLEGKGLRRATQWMPLASYAGFPGTTFKTLGCALFAQDAAGSRKEYLWNRRNYPFLGQRHRNISETIAEELQKFDLLEKAPGGETCLVKTTCDESRPLRCAVS